MKTKIVLIVGIALILTGVYMSFGQTEKKPEAVKLYWQDKLAKPSQEWIEAYGYNNESVLAFNILRLYEINLTYRKAIEELDKEIVALQNLMKKEENVIEPNKPADK